MRSESNRPACLPVNLMFVQAESPAQISQARELFLEYSQSLGFSLCFQNFDQELRALPGDYAPPRGRLLLTECDGLGQVLAERIISEAREIGYQRMRLDTVEPVMKDAVAMYRRLGFKEIAPYCANPMEGTLYMELHL